MIPVRTQSRNLMLACICLVAFANFHCGRTRKSTSTDESKVTVLYMGDERIFFQEYSGMEASYLIFLPLVALEGDEYGEPQPVLAESWEHSEDYREWTFFLRKDVKWHDGVPMTAHDVKFTMDLRKHLAMYGVGAHRYSVEVLDDLTFKVTYKNPTDGLNWYDVYYPKHLLEGLDPKEFWNWEFWVQPIGNGPYRYVRHVPKTMVEVEANPDYYRGKPKIERAILKFSQQPSLNELLSGNVDALTFASRDMLIKLSGDDRFRSYHWWGSQIEAIHWNHRNPLFSSPEVRRALTMAINRRELAGVLNYPDGVPVLDAITTRRQFRRDLYPEPLPYDPETARQLLEEAGWRDTDGDGVRDRDGQEFRFTAVTEPRLVYQKIAVYVQDQFRRIGVIMEIQVVDKNIVWRRLRVGDFDALISRTQNLPGSGHVGLLGEDSPFGYHNPEIIRLLNLAKYAINPDEKDSICQEIMPIFSADLPITYLLPQVQTHIVQRRIRGLSSPYRPDPVWFMEYLWMEDDEGVAE